MIPRPRACHRGKREEDCTSYNTRLPAPLAALAPPNPCPVTAFAEEQERKCRARAAGSATWER